MFVNSLKTDIAIKHKNEMLRSKMSCNWRETKDYKNLLGLEKALWKIFNVPMSFEALLCKDRAYALMLQEQNEKEHTGQALHFKHFQKEKKTIRQEHTVQDNYGPWQGKKYR